ncbi:MAG: hypothetical protein JWM57_147 [Phycisphaerales bacterium]|nr:hypothetical protein [Phycisphaerales bacterium]
MVFPVFFVFSSRRLHQQPAVLAKPAEASERVDVSHQTKTFNGDGTLSRENRKIEHSYGQD